MRIRTLTGLALAGAASVGALTLAGAAYAGGDPEPEPVVQIVTDECPDKGGDGGTSAPGGSL